MSKQVYVLFYDCEDSGSRESCSVFYTPFEVFSSEEARDKFKAEILEKTQKERDDEGWQEKIDPDYFFYESETTLHD